MKKLFKILVVLLCLCLVLSVAAFFVLKSIFTEEKIKIYVDDAAQKFIGRQVKYDKVSFNLIGITLTGFAISENPTFEKGTFAKMEKLAVKVELKPLFRKEVRIKRVGITGLEIDVVKDKTGKFNFDDILQRFASAEEKQETEAKEKEVKEKAESNPLDLAAIMLSRFYVKDSRFSFEDLSADMKVSLENLNINMNDFSFTDKFSADANFKVIYKQADKEAVVTISLDLTADLKNMDLSQAYAEIKPLKISFEDASIAGNIFVKNFAAPEISADVVIESITNDTIKQFVSDLPKFKLIKTEFSVGIRDMDMETGSLDLKSFKATAEGASISAKASVVNFSSPTINADVIIESVTNATVKQYVQDLPNFKLEKTEFSVSMKDMDMKQGALDLKSFKASVEGMPVFATASINNFTNPDISLDASVSNLTSNALKNFVEDIPAFKISKLDFGVGAVVNIEKNSAEIKSLSIGVPGISLDASGTANWAKDLKYNIKTKAALALESLASIIPEMVAPYDPKGKIDLDAQVTQDVIKASVKAREIAFKFEPMFTGEKINADINMASVDDIKISGLNGLINGKKFTGQVKYLKTKTAMNIDLDMNADGLIIIAFPESSNTSAAAPAPAPASGATAGAKPVAVAAAEPLPLNINANIKAGEIRIPYFICEKGATITANLTGVTDKLDKTNGTVKFNVTKGVIEDIDALAQTNKFTKIAFSSLSIAYKLAKTFQIGGWQGTKDDGLAFDAINGDLSFVTGKMTAKTMDLISELLTMKITGTADFKADKLDMKASIQPGVNKPVIMKITGTTSNPKGSLDVVSSAVSILGDDKKVNNAVNNLLGGIIPKASTSTADTQNATDTKKQPSAADVLNSLGTIFNKK
ncbi:MAG: AsmA family protein [Endomicrobia bacterium]|nr:AsmA family protein [Endomicrobiia bacterium]MCL2506813.1 AsmA family protein [Endomicrobiia bacterium]